MTAIGARAVFPGLLCAAWAVVADAGTPVCHRSDATAPAMARLREALAQGRFVAYEPTSLRVVDGRETPADAAGIRADLGVLRTRFDALVTYEALHGTQAIPATAAALKYRALIITVWNPADPNEIEAAIDAARAYPKLVAGVALGNELLFAERSDAARLAQLAAALHARVPQLPLGTSEPFHVFAEPGAPALLAQLDFLLPNVHPAFQPWFHGSTSDTQAQFVVNVTADLATRFCGPILVKESGLPTAPAGSDFSEGAQAAFYAELRRRFPSGPERAFAYFAAFDEPWRAQDVTPTGPAHPEEAHWGLYDAERAPKRAARELPPLVTSPRVPP